MNSIEKTISEGDSYPLSVSFVDTDGVAGAPATVSYRVDCLTTGQEVVDWTSVAPAASVNITVSTVQNKIINDANRRELKRVLIKSVDSGGNTLSDAYRYWVMNEQGVQ